MSGLCECAIYAGFMTHDALLYGAFEVGQQSANVHESHDADRSSRELAAPTGLRQNFNSMLRNGHASSSVEKRRRRRTKGRRSRKAVGGGAGG